MIQIKIFRGPLSTIEDELNIFLKLSNIEYVDLKTIDENTVVLVYDYIEPTKWNDIIAHVSKSKTLDEILKSKKT